ncbi:hypothetical protein [Actinoplanes sp. GCM10030250]|uniref:hypothetical protein n=1 Tax=Actinoplanes sp. GCM10030250 TaxID=3273376 RepID=UPI00360C187E
MKPPSRWAVAAAYTVPLCVLPSAVWRLTVEESGIHWYLILLSILSMALAMLTLGLVHRWGERLGSARAVTGLAITGGALLVAISSYFFVNQAFDLVGRGWSFSALQDDVVHEKPGWDVLRYYLPLVAWGPLLIAVALDYRRRASR